MVGQLIGNYRVTRKIGDGGMGSVFEAVHEGIGRRVAVKILHPAFSQDSGVLQRFFNEARAVNIVQQPGIVGIFDYGQLPDGRAYLIMEYLEGEPLGARLRRLGRLGLDALRIGRQIAGTLVAAHQKGITHRDLKPDNVIMVPDPEAPGGERAKVLDFGIAKITSERPADQNAGTQSGTVMGTPKYMAPEQCQGLDDVGPKADVYSLGVVLFELLCGRLPFISDSPGALLAAHRHKAPPLLQEIDPSTPPQIEALVQAMLAKDPERRPHMAEVVGSLEYLNAWLSSAMPVFSGPQVMASGGYLPAAAVTPIHSSPSIVASQSRPSLSQLAGQAQPQPRNAVSRLLVPSALMVVVFAVVFVGLREVQHRGREEHRHAVALPTKVRWTVKSQPPGAQVLRVGSEQPLGQTPLQVEMDLGSGQAALVLRKEGYFDHQVRLDLARDQEETVTLDAVPQAKPEPQPEPKAQAESKPAASAPPADLPPPEPEAKPKAHSHHSHRKHAQETPKDDDTELAPIR